MALADRCYVIYRGELVAEWQRHELDREAIGLAMGGVVTRRARRVGRIRLAPRLGRRRG